MSGTSGAVQNFYFPPPDGAATWTINENFTVLNGPIYIMVPCFSITVLKGDSMVGHQIRLNPMHPVKSSCLRLNLCANGLNGLTD